jgi:hypothetical protein
VRGAQDDLPVAVDHETGVRGARLGRHEAAHAITREAVEVYRALAKRSPDAFQPDLARSLNNLGSRLKDLGLHKAALGPMEEAL